ncbi:uncharacterized protein MYCFIDRAFT_195308 [Pseudocercospora fijiensis CIRAD86]|uniref:Uncharacterized protein n=1 Tax=Pseudocercospora fijiensis (strain CIRAD86) TaxID=383855 RepID=M3B4A6_PSEFD|nr:uncharacterized protein MYCFIDRAFT_195308 [Pseudocercospora fijiensis CIRAD86]EME84182.1 hypothetical protein MYCFIDRAFT_195308 [Pseudocercospora fijiensis CIRAD86]
MIETDFDCPALAKTTTEAFAEIVSSDGWKQPTFVDDLKEIYAIEDEAIGALRQWLSSWIPENFQESQRCNAPRHYDAVGEHSPSRRLAVETLPVKFSVKVAPPE